MPRLSSLRKFVRTPAGEVLVASEATNLLTRQTAPSAASAALVFPRGISVPSFSGSSTAFILDGH
jgi:hypothetical protein